MNAETSIRPGVLLRTIARFPLYAFSEAGEVVSYTRRAPFIMKPIKMGAYVGLQLKNASGDTEKEYLHRLICEAFHGPCPAGMLCCHDDGDRTNNAASNLRWDTQSNNNLDKHRHGTAPTGERNPVAKLTEEDVSRMRALRASSGEPYSAIAIEFGVSTMTAYRAIVGQSWGCV